MNERIIPLWLLFALGFAAFFLPFCLLPSMPLTALLLGIAIPILWIWRMPSTCMSGGFGASLIAMGQLASLLSWAVMGTCVLLKRFTSLPFWVCFVIAIPLFMTLFIAGVYLVCHRSRDGK